MDDGPPEKIASDYAEMVTLLLMFAMGAPLNLIAFTQLAEKPARTRLDILKRHLNYSDLMVLLIYVPSRACWLATYDWRGGDFLCRLIKFLHTLAFQVSSNVIVVIAMDRLLTVVSASHRQPNIAQRRMRLMLSVAWGVALLIASPQFVIWRSYLAFQKPVQWSQCMQIWEIAKIELFRSGGGTLSTTFNSQSLGRGERAGELMHEENVYTLMHILLIFWVPSVIIFACYAFITCWVYMNSKPSNINTRKLRTVGISSIEQPPADVQRKSLLNLSTVSYCDDDDDRNGKMEVREQSSSGALAANGLASTATHTTTVTTGFTSATAALNRPKILINDQDRESPIPLSQLGGNESRANGKLATVVLVEQRAMAKTAETTHREVCSSVVRSSQSSTCSARANRKKAIRVSFLLVSGYLACWLPYNTLSLIQFVDAQAFAQHANKFYCLHVFIVFNSVINPYLYGIFGLSFGLCRRRRRDS